MTERKIEALKLGGQTIYVEVTEVEQESSKCDGDLSDYEFTSATSELIDAGERIRSTISALAATIQKALVDARPSEWGVEITIGFKGKAGIPFITEGEANGAVKVNAKWKRD